MLSVFTSAFGGGMNWHTYASRPLHFQRKVFLVFVHNDFVYFSHKRFEGNHNQQTFNKRESEQQESAGKIVEASALPHNGRIEELAGLFNARPRKQWFRITILVL